MELTHSAGMKQCTWAHQFLVKADQLRHEVGDVGLNVLRSVGLYWSGTIAGSRHS